jgi:antagonist of KipI
MTLHILDPGLSTLVVDLGRPRSRSLGVPVGGAADRAALMLGNALVGTPPDAAGLEMSLTGPTVRADAELACVVYGAPFTLHSGRQRLRVGTTFTLSPGEELHVGGTGRGMRAYLCVAGGVDVPVILGSRSGLAPLVAGTDLPCPPGRIRGRFIRPELRYVGDPHVLRVVDGPQADWFGGNALYRAAFTVTPAANRMGLRLDGDVLRRREVRELTSEPVCPGSVQVTHDGRCILLGVDGQTIGGYPKVAHVIDADLDKLGQLRPGEAITFMKVTLDEAERLHHQRRVELAAWVLRLRFSLTDRGG